MLRGKPFNSVCIPIQSTTKWSIILWEQDWVLSQNWEIHISKLYFLGWRPSHSGCWHQDESCMQTDISDTPNTLKILSKWSIFSPGFGIAQMRFVRKKNLNSIFRMPAEQHFNRTYISYNEQMAISNFFFQPPVPHPSLSSSLTSVPLYWNLYSWSLLIWILNEQTPI